MRSKRTFTVSHRSFHHELNHQKYWIFDKLFITLKVLMKYRHELCKVDQNNKGIMTNFFFMRGK